MCSMPSIRHLQFRVSSTTFVNYSLSLIYRSTINYRVLNLNTQLCSAGRMIVICVEILKKKNDIRVQKRGEK